MTADNLIPEEAKAKYIQAVKAAQAFSNDAEKINKMAMTAVRRYQLTPGNLAWLKENFGAKPKTVTRAGMRVNFDDLPKPDVIPVNDELYQKLIQRAQRVLSKDNPELAKSLEHFAKTVQNLHQNLMVKLKAYVEMYNNGKLPTNIYFEPREMTKTYVHHLKDVVAQNTIQGLGSVWAMLVADFNGAAELALSLDDAAFKQFAVSVSAGCFEACIDAANEFKASEERKARLSAGNKIEVKDVREALEKGMGLIESQKPEYAEDALAALDKVVKIKGLNSLPREEVLAELKEIYSYESKANQEKIAQVVEKTSNDSVMPDHQRKSMFIHEIKSAAEKWNNEWGEPSFESVFNKAQEQYNQRFNNVGHLKMTDANFVALKTDPDVQAIFKQIKPTSTVGNLSAKVKPEIENKEATKVKPKKGLFNAAHLQDLQQRKEQAKERFKDPNEVVSKKEEDKDVVAFKQNLHENLQELLRSKHVEMPSYITAEMFEKYLLGEIEIDDLLKLKPGSSARKHAQQSPQFKQQPPQLMAELHERLGIKSPQLQEPQPRDKQEISENKKPIVAKPLVKEEQISLSVIRKRLAIAADNGMAGVNRPLDGENGIVNYLFNKTKVIEGRKLNKDQLRMIDAQKQAGQAVQDKEAFLAHAKKYPTVARQLERENEPAAPLQEERKKPHVLQKVNQGAALAQEKTAPLPATNQQKPPADLPKTISNKENAHPNAPTTPSKPDIYVQTWESYSKKFNKLVQRPDKGYITNNAIKRIQDFIKKHDKGHQSLSAHHDRLMQFRNDLLHIHSKDHELKALIEEFCSTFKQLPLPPEHNFKIQRKT